MLQAHNNHSLHILIMNLKFFLKAQHLYKHYLHTLLQSKCQETWYSPTKEPPQLASWCLKSNVLHSPNSLKQPPLVDLLHQ